MSTETPDRPTAVERALDVLTAAELASHLFVASDGYPARSLHGNGEAAQRAVDALVEAGLLVDLEATAWEWGFQYPESCVESCGEWGGEKAARNRVQITHMYGVRLMRRPVGPWQEVPSDER